MIEGACRCGAVRWSFEGEVDGATACNCTTCRRYGTLLAYDYEDQRIRVSGPTSTYSAGNALFPLLPDLRLRRLLAQPPPRTRWPTADRSQSAAGRTGGVAAIPIDHFDGLNTFEDLPRDGRCVADYWF